MSIFTVILLGVAILIGISCVGIFIIRMSDTIKKFTSKSQTILFLVILTIFASFMEYNQSGDGDVIGAISYAFGFVYVLTIPSAFFAVLIMNKFKNNKEEFWNSLFFCLTMVLIILIRRIF